MRKYLPLGLLLCVVVASGQTAPTSTVATPPAIVPFDPTPIAAALGSQSAWTTWAQNSISTLGTNQASDEAKIKTFSDQSTAVGTLQQQVQQLQNQLAADEARITTLENSLKALQIKATTAGNALAAP